MGIDLEALPIGKEAPRVVNAVVEAPVGSRNKYEYDPELGLLALDRVLPGNIRYPVDYGFLPSTVGADGEPLDVMVAAYEPVFSGCILRARVIGALEMYEDGGPEYNILALPRDDHRFDDTHEVEDMPEQNLREVEQFFTIYKRLEGDEDAEARRWLGREEAYEIIRKAMDEAKAK